MVIQHRRSIRTLFVPLALALFLAAAPGCRGAAVVGMADEHPAPAAVQPAPPEGAAAADTIVEAPRDLTAFSPDDTSITADARHVNLRQVFEDLGPDATLWYQHVQTLANPFFEGRMPGSHGSRLTAEYIEFWFRLYGLEPAFPVAGEEPGGGAASMLTYQQPFVLSQRQRVTVVHASLSIGREKLDDGRDFVVLGSSGSGEVAAPVTFVGYGIEEGPDEYSSFDAATDLRGRVALLLRQAPMDGEGRPLWEQREYRRLAAMSRKAQDVARRGASAILMVNPPGATPAREGLESVDSTVGWGALEVPMFQVTHEAAEALLARADPQSRDLETLRRLADQGGVTSVALADDLIVSLEAEVERREVPVANVGGILPGRGELADEWVVISAHHDHVGDGAMGGINPRNRGQLHPGADDNASGTAGVLVLARRISEAYAGDDAADDLRSVLFVTFDAEELGLIGSRHFAQNPPLDLKDVSLAINLDMVGRLRGDQVMVLGAATGAGLRDALEPHFRESGLTVAVDGRGSGRSDDASFQRAQVPALHFFTGMTREYTTPADQAYTVNPAGADLVLDLIEDIALDVAAREQKFAYEEPPASPGRNRGYARVRLGITPGMGGEVEMGVLVEDVAQDTSAADAGIVPGDIIVAWEGQPLEEVRDLFGRLRAHQPGDRVKLTVLREGREIVLEVTLKEGAPPASPG